MQLISQFIHHLIRIYASLYGVIKCSLNNIPKRNEHQRCFNKGWRKCIWCNANKLHSHGFSPLAVLSLWHVWHVYMVYTHTQLECLRSPYILDATFMVVSVLYTFMSWEHTASHFSYRLNGQTAMNKFYAKSNIAICERRTNCRYDAVPQTRAFCCVFSGWFFKYEVLQI